MPQSVRCSESLSVGQSSSSMSDRTGQPVVETMAKSHDRKGQPVVETSQEQKLEHAQIGALLDDRKSKFSPTVRRKSGDTNSRPIMTEEVHKNLVKRSSRSKKNFVALKQKNAIDEINNFFMNSY